MFGLKRITIHDVAAASGVSISTVHQALNGKRGVSEATRERIRIIAADMGYQPNAIASSLKRKTRHIVVFLPSESNHNRYYYPPIWQGLRDCLSSLPDLNISCTEIAYHFEESLDEQNLVSLRKMIANGKVNGLLTVGHMDVFSQREWDDMKRNDIAVTQISSDNLKSHAICCVQPDYEIIGRTMAELITERIPACGSIVLCAGNPKWDAHAFVVKGFESYLHDNRLENKIYYQYSWRPREKSLKEILKLISQPDVAACCSVLTQSSILLGEALELSGKVDRLFAVGSDLCDENIERLKCGILNNLVQKNPYAQGFIGMKTLVEYLVQGKRPADEVIYVGSEVVFRSNLPMYNHGNYRSLLL